MIFQLPTPLRGETHLRLYRLDEVVGAWVEARGYLGRMKGGEFEKAEGLRDLLLPARGAEYDVLLAFAQEEGAPEGEYRKADLVNFVFDDARDSDFTWI